jgi:putative transposase
MFFTIFLSPRFLGIISEIINGLQNNPFRPAQQRLVFQKHSRGDGKLYLKKEPLVRICQGLFIGILFSVLLQREGWSVNHKRLYRLYREEGLALRKKPPRQRVASVKREIAATAEAKNDCWSMDFVSDQLYDGRRLRILTIVDNHTRESLALKVRQRIRERTLVYVTGGCKGEDRSLAPGIQHRTTSQFAWLPSAGAGDYKTNNKLDKTSYGTILKNDTITGGRTPGKIRSKN